VDRLYVHEWCSGPARIWHRVLRRQWRFFRPLRKYPLQLYQYKTHRLADGCRFQKTFTILSVPLSRSP
jgi:hypothetical protein